MSNKPVPPGLEIGRLTWQEVEPARVISRLIVPGEVVTAFRSVNQVNDFEKNICERLDQFHASRGPRVGISEQIARKPLGGELRPSKADQGSPSSWWAVAFEWQKDHVPLLSSTSYAGVLPESGVTLLAGSDVSVRGRVIGSLIKEVLYYFTPNAKKPAYGQVRRATSVEWIIQAPGGMAGALTGGNARERGRQAAEYATTYVYK